MPARKPSIAIIGASDKRAKFGNKAVRAYLKVGWRVIPVNPNAQLVEGVKAVPDVSKCRGKLDAVSVYVPPAVGIGLLESIAKAAAPIVYFNPGSESAEIVAKARKLGIKAAYACSIRAIGQDPADYA